VLLREQRIPIKYILGCSVSFWIRCPGRSYSGALSASVAVDRCFRHVSCFAYTAIAEKRPPVQNIQSDDWSNEESKWRA